MPKSVSGKLTASPGICKTGPFWLHAFISSMYTVPELRRKGIGGRLLRAALDHAWERGITDVTLHASESGRSLYESFGFKSTNEMRLRRTERKKLEKTI